jgi:hypothetical protein
VSWEVWLSGGDTGEGWQGVGMQKLYDTVRAAGADNLVIVGGLDWAYDLSGVPSHRVAALEALPVTRDPGGLDGGEGDAAPLVLDDGSRTLRMTPMRAISGAAHREQFLRHPSDYRTAPRWQKRTFLLG